MKLIPLLLFVPMLSMAGLKFPSDRLKVMDIETLQRIVTSNLDGAQKALTNEALEKENLSDHSPENDYTKEEGALLIQESLELIFARPEQNGATSVVYNNVEGIAVDYGGIFHFLETIVAEALTTLNQSGRDQKLLRDQNTYIYILNNMMAEIRPLALSKEGKKFKKLIEKIRDEDIEFSDSLKSYRVLNSMSNITNPSKVAEQIVGEKDCAWWEFLWC